MGRCMICREARRRGGFALVEALAAAVILAAGAVVLVLWVLVLLALVGLALAQDTRLDNAVRVAVKDRVTARWLARAGVNVWDAAAFYGEDHNLNGVFDPGENDGEVSWPGDNRDDLPGRGLAVEGMTVARLKEMGPYVCVRSAVFSVRSLGRADRTGLVHETEAVLVRNGGEVAVVYWWREAA